MGARRILLEVALGCMRCLRQLLSDGDHGLGRSVTVGGIVGVFVERSLCSWRKLTEWKSISNEGSQMSRKRGPIRIVVWDALGVAFDPSIEFTCSRQKLSLRLRPRGEGSGGSRTLSQSSGGLKIVVVIVDVVGVLGFRLGLFLLLLG